MKIYIAAPFFREEQRNVVKRIEEVCAERYFEYYSPMTHGGIIEKDHTKEQLNKIFIENIGAMNWCDAAIVVIDDWDKGTMWEMGYLYALGKPIYAYTDVKGRGMNVMLAKSIYCFSCGIEKLRRAFSDNEIVKYVGDMQ